MASHGVALTVGLAILNGLFSPALIAVFALNALWMPFFLPASPPLIFLLSSLIVSTLTLMIGGVPAALYERITGVRETGPVSAAIWFAATLLLSLPAVPNIVKALGL